MKITIDTHNASREEVQELIDYLDDQSWEWEQPTNKDIPKVEDNDILELRGLATTTSPEIETEKLDRVYNEILLPYLKDRANRLKKTKISLSDNLHDQKAVRLMKELFDGRFTIQRLIETEMKPYLEEKGFKIITWTPAYSVEVAW